MFDAFYSFSKWIALSSSNSVRLVCFFFFQLYSIQKLVIVIRSFYLFTYQLNILILFLSIRICHLSSWLKFLFNFCCSRVFLSFHFFLFYFFKLVVVVDGVTLVPDYMQNYCWICMNNHHHEVRVWQHLKATALMLEWEVKHESRDRKIESPVLELMYLFRLCFRRHWKIHFKFIHYKLTTETNSFLCEMCESVGKVEKITFLQ